LLPSSPDHQPTSSITTWTGTGMNTFKPFPILLLPSFWFIIGALPPEITTPEATNAALLIKLRREIWFIDLKLINYKSKIKKNLQTMDGTKEFENLKI
jgi:hypothetical protein